VGCRPGHHPSVGVIRVDQQQRQAAGIHTTRRCSLLHAWRSQDTPGA